MLKIPFMPRGGEIFRNFLQLEQNFSSLLQQTKRIIIKSFAF